MPKITKIQSQKKRDGYYNIFVDDAFFCSLSELQVAIQGLRVGQDISESKKLDIAQDSEFIKTYNRALYYLKFGPRSEKQMRDYLLRKDFAPEHVDKAISSLTGEGYINDRRLSQNFVEDRMLFKPRSVSQLKIELIKKGIGKDIIVEVLSQIDQDSQLESIRAIVVKKSKQERYQDPVKLMQYLAGKGFHYSDIKTVLGEGDI